MKNQESTVKPPSVVWVDWDKETVRADLDKTPLPKVKYLAFKANNWFKLDGFIILLSSSKTYQVKNEELVLYQYKECSYHIVFNKRVTWTKNCKIRAWIAIISQQESAKNYALMQDIKETSSLRLGWKGSKKPPKIIYRHGNQNNQIRKYLDTRRFILNSLGKISKNKVSTT